ncbi:hypothetical protein DICSQDRAFT_55616 [Dichomitus squalens LYAD-421 SS1]|nr:uncharacterized protein DICSQDRAFT_55616 [Dichomitus squalens LYAD-421 SS1]EJF63273.1 hypothetical protein DICSQDRAFT_55616 [Dichomitus squalens LYAD-421 SS1]
MCVCFWTLDHPEYALILCSNRDEYLHRPTAPAHWHSFGPINADNTGEGSVLSGRDLLAGGTWAGISRGGRVALLTNITEPIRKYASSRGDLASLFLLPPIPKPTLKDEIDAFLDAHRDGVYAGFNLLVLSPSPSTDLGANGGLSLEGAILTNHGGGGTITARMLSEDERHVGGMSNGIEGHGAEEWPKVQHGRQAMRDLLHGLPQDAMEAQIADQLFELLTWTSEKAPVDRSELRNTIHVKPLRVPLHTMPEGAGGATGTPPSHLYYGTRLSTVILIRRDGHVTFIERDVWTLDDSRGGEGAVPKRDSGGDRVFHFQIPRDPCAEHSSS